MVSEHDYLQHYLYQASQSERVRKSKARATWIITVGYLLLALYIWYNGSKVLGLMLGVIAIAWLLLYPVWHRWRFRRHYRQHIRESLGAAQLRQTAIRTDEQFIFVSDGQTESKIRLTEISGVVEISDELFVRLKTGVTIIFPKQKITDLAALQQSLRQLALALQVTYKEDLDWQWK